jgi:NAD(P)-dependent dehydrogenase (short-subunit alcohol dehydrogenase family)
MELAPHGIRVTGIGPGLIETPMTNFLTTTPAILNEYLENIPQGRVGTPDDIASAALFLVSDEASWVNGDTLFVDGAELTKRYPLVLKRVREMLNQR